MWIAFVCIACFVFFMVSREHAKINEDMYHPVEKTDLNQSERKLLNLINSHRSYKGLTTLKPEVLASAICDDVVSDCLIDEKEISHYQWEKRGDESGAEMYGEICGQNLPDAESLFLKYLNSPGHRVVIENPIYQWIGLSFKEDVNYCLFTKY